MAEKLKPCPFCGDTEPALAQELDIGAWSITCIHCAIQIGNYAGERSVRSAWNRRAPAQPEPAAPVERIKEAFCYCGEHVSLQMVSGGAHKLGYLGEVTLKIDGEYVQYQKAAAPTVVDPRTREMFEHFCANNPMGIYSVERKGDGYWSSHTQLMWLAYQVAATPPRAALTDGDCQHCEGAGTVREMTTDRGPDDYEYDAECGACFGTGSADVRDAIKALGYQLHSVKPHTEMVSRKEVLQILDVYGIGGPRNE